jgi:hypothetical protein
MYCYGSLKYNTAYIGEPRMRVMEQQKHNQLEVEM